jgi:hypothetical protein
MTIVENKLLLRLLGYAALANGVVALVCWLFAFSELVPVARTASIVGAAFLFAVVVMGATVWVMTDYVRDMHDFWQGKKELNFNEGVDVRALTQWSPRWLNWLAVVMFCFGVVVGWVFGGASWSDKLGFSDGAEESLSMLSAMLSFLAAPVLASAARMPGTFEDHLEERLAAYTDAHQ